MTWPQGGGQHATVQRLRAGGCVFAEEEAALLAGAATDAAHLDVLVAQRVAGRPVEYLVGWAEFAGQRFAVTDGVFIPRHRSELLTTTARKLIHSGHTVLDLCCGSGALGAVAVRGREGVRLVAADVDPAAVACARRNLPGAEVYEGDLFAALPAGLCADVILANVPYVPTGEIAYLPEEFRVHEARTALDGGADGLAVLRRVAEGLPGRLAPGGQLLTEAAGEQLDAVHEVLRGAGLHPRTVRDDDTETTVVVGTAPM